MKAKKVLCFFLAALLFCGVPAYAAELSPEEQADRLLEVSGLIRDYGLFSSEDEDPLRELMADLFREDPALADALTDRILKLHDNRSGFYPAEDYEISFPEQKSYVGVGLSMRATAEGFSITEVAAGGAAEQAGILPGDLIVAVDGVPVDGLDTSALSSRVRGEEGTSVSLTVLRGGERKTFTMIRKKVGISNLSFSIPEPGIGYLQLTRFDTADAYLEFCAAWSGFYEQGVKAVILDLRGNPGGSLSMAEQLLQQIVPEAGISLFGLQQRPDAGGFQVAVSHGRSAPFNRLIVLVDESSASASELIAGVLRDIGYAEVVGTRTYGKSTGQYHITLTDGSTVALTGLAILLPSGENYEDVGLTPTVYVENELSSYPMPALLPLDPGAAVWPGNYSQQTRALNQRLSLLGALNKPEWAFGTFDGQTLEAIHLYQTACGLPREDYASPALLRRVSQEIEKLAGTTVIIDRQLEKAMELARSVQNEPAAYVFDEFGDPVAAPGS